MHTKQVLWNYSNKKRKKNDCFYQVVGEGSLTEVKPAAVTSSLLTYSKDRCQMKGRKAEIGARKKWPDRPFLTSVLNRTKQLSWVPTNSLPIGVHPVFQANEDQFVTH